VVYFEAVPAQKNAIAGDEKGGGRYHANAFFQKVASLKIGRFSRTWGKRGRKPAKEIITEKDKSRAGRAKTPHGEDSKETPDKPRVRRVKTVIVEKSPGERKKHEEEESRERKAEHSSRFSSLDPVMKVPVDAEKEI
jgi:hypothetical protein